MGYTNCFYGCVATEEQLLDQVCRFMIKYAWYNDFQDASTCGYCNWFCLGSPSITGGYCNLFCLGSPRSIGGYCNRVWLEIGIATVEQLWPMIYEQGSDADDNGVWNQVLWIQAWVCSILIECNWLCLEFQVWVYLLMWSYNGRLMKHLHKLLISVFIFAQNRFHSTWDFLVVISTSLIAKESNARITKNWQWN